MGRLCSPKGRHLSAAPQCRVGGSSLPYWERHQRRVPSLSYQHPSLQWIRQRTPLDFAFCSILRLHPPFSYKTCAMAAELRNQPAKLKMINTVISVDVLNEPPRQDISVDGMHVSSLFGLGGLPFTSGARIITRCRGIRGLR